jgi:hypothetical protein
MLSIADFNESKSELTAFAEGVVKDAKTELGEKKTKKVY